jgi:hypothetical protein
LDEFAGPFDQEIDMTLSCEIHYVLWLILIEELPECRSVADIDLFKLVPVVTARLRDGVETGRIGKFVNIDDSGLCIVEQMSRHGRADKSGATGHEYNGIFEAH